MTTLTIPQGTTRTIKISSITDADGNPLDVSSWAVHAVARDGGVAGPVVAEWATNPTGSQGTATASGTTVTLAIPAAMSSAWYWDTALLHVEVTEPGVNGRVERIASATLVLDHEVVI